MLQVNQIAPDFTTTDAEGTSYRLSEQKGKYVVLYFYPKDSTPGCTAEACDFRDSNDELLALNAVVWGISNNSAKDHTKFADKHKLNFPLLLDEDKEIVNKYQVYGKKKFMGREYMGIYRTTFLIDPSGTIVYVWENVNPLGHAKAVVDKVRELAKS